MKQVKRLFWSLGMILTLIFCGLSISAESGEESKFKAIYGKGEEEITIATGSPGALGLLKALAEPFCEENGCRINWIEKGSGASLDFMKAGKCDLVMVHALEAEEKAIDDEDNAQRQSSNELELFVGSATKPPTEEAARIFQEKFGVKINLHFGGSGAMLSQMILSKRGDAYFPGSSDFMERAKRKGMVLPDTEKIVVYLIPAINIQKGNPRKIHKLEDLTRPGLRVAIANPKTVCVGLYAAEVLDKAGLTDKVRPNIATYTESCAKTCQIVALKNVDAVIGWRVFQYWSPENVETILLPPESISRIGYVPIAISRFCKNRPLAQKFIDFVASPEVKEIYKKWNYLTTEKEARKFAPQAKVGGEWFLPDQWQ